MPGRTNVFAAFRNKSPLVIGVAGGTGSGKTTVVQEIVKALDSKDVIVLQHDSYYRDRSHLPLEERSTINYDHPDALETDLFVLHLKQLVAGKSVKVPAYDFSTHTRRQEINKVSPARVIIVEGILIFVDKSLRELMDVKVYVDTDDDERFIRRMERDVKDRGRIREDVVQQYLDTVKPMHWEFVEPSKRFADLIIPEGGYNTVAIDLIITKIRTMLS